MAGLPWKDMVTFGTALLGAALGVMNTWSSIDQRRVRIRVRPAFAYSVPNFSKAVSIDITNLSAFPLTFVEVGLVPKGARGKMPLRVMLQSPLITDGRPWPRQLAPRESATVLVDPQYYMHGREIDRAYVRTSCGEIAFGSSPALKQLRTNIA